jgi:putative flippase GtrA
MARLRAQFARFLVAGAINTAVTYALYVALLRPLGYAIAYAVAYACGIAISYVLNARFVFHAPLRLADFLRFPIVYVVQYLLSAAGLWLLVEHAGVPAQWALAVVIAITVPVVFAASRRLLAPR